MDPLLESKDQEYLEWCHQITAGRTLPGVEKYPGLLPQSLLWIPSKLSHSIRRTYQCLIHDNLHAERRRWSE